MPPPASTSTPAHTSAPGTRPQVKGGGNGAPLSHVSSSPPENSASHHKDVRLPRRGTVSQMCLTLSKRQNWYNRNFFFQLKIQFVGLCFCKIGVCFSVLGSWVNEIRSVFLLTSKTPQNCLRYHCPCSRGACGARETAAVEGRPPDRPPDRRRHCGHGQESRRKAEFCKHTRGRPFQGKGKSKDLEMTSAAWLRAQPPGPLRLGGRGGWAEAFYNVQLQPEGTGDTRLSTRAKRRESKQQREQRRQRC